MTLSTIYNGDRQVQIETVAPAAQASTNSTVVVTDSAIDVRGWRSLAYTIVVATNAIKWSVFGANAADFSDEVAVLTATTVAAAANSSYSVAQAPFAYYRVKITSDVADTHGTATVRGIAKS